MCPQSSQAASQICCSKPIVADGPTHYTFFITFSRRPSCLSQSICFPEIDRFFAFVNSEKSACFNMFMTNFLSIFIFAAELSFPESFKIVSLKIIKLCRFFFQDLVLQILKSCIDEVYPMTSAMDFSHGLCELLHCGWRKVQSVCHFFFALVLCTAGLNVCARNYTSE